jgi:hypothetical protein
MWEKSILSGAPNAEKNSEKRGLARFRQFGSVPVPGFRSPDEGEATRATPFAVFALFADWEGWAL